MFYDFGDIVLIERPLSDEKPFQARITLVGSQSEFFIVERLDNGDSEPCRIRHIAGIVQANDPSNRNTTPVLY